MTNIVAMAVALALQVEGAGDDTVRDLGRAVGQGQMWPCAVAEVNRIIHTNKYTLADRSDIVKVREMCRITLQFHHARHPDRGVVWLASRWRTPYRCVAKTRGDVRHRAKLEREYERMMRLR